MIPTAIWDEDKATITSWIKLRPTRSRDNHRIITDFYLFVQKPILGVGESDLRGYHTLLLQEYGKNTADQYMRAIRRFFEYSRESNGNTDNSSLEQR